jgi:2-dehydropantoate 2-reductase
MGVSEARPSEPIRILVLGAAVIGSVYAGKLLQTGHDVVLSARGTGLTDLRTGGLVRGELGVQAAFRVADPVVDSPEADQRYDLVLAAVRAEQLAATLPVLMGMSDGSDVPFFGSVAGHGPTLIEALGLRAVFGSGGWRIQMAPRSGMC